jgi:tetratricopeptide (TPR) repeat protein
MKSKKAATATQRTETAAPRKKIAEQPAWLPWAGAGLALLALIWAYSAVMRTQFLFDDTNQKFALPAASDPLASWIGAVRPVLMFTYWANVQMSNGDTFSFHLLNLMIHALAAVFVFLVIRRLMEWAGSDTEWRTRMAAFGALIFLLHPLQTESVAYIAGRSEALSGMFAMGSIAAFVWRRSEAISWGGVAAVLLLFGAALLSKEQAVVIPAVLLLTDFWWDPDFSFRGILRNWKLYTLMAAGALAGVALFWKLILGVGTGGTAGFGIKEFTWYQYLFTQFRALFVYIANFVLPVNLNLDWEFSISRTIVDRGAIFGLIALAALAAAAWHFRRRFRLASYGYFLFLVLLLPTSSILPIKDPVADRRMYLPMIGLILIAIDFLGRAKMDRKTLAAVCGVVLLGLTVLTHARAEIWSDPIALWEDTVRKSPGKSRPHFQLAQAYTEQQRFDRAVEEFEKAAAIDPPGFDLLIDVGLAYEGLHQPEKALARLRQAVTAATSARDTAHAYTQVGKVYAEQRQWKEANEALNAAEKTDPSFPATYAYKGLVCAATGDLNCGIRECQRALVVDPTFQPAKDCLATISRMAR